MGRTGRQSPGKPATIHDQKGTRGNGGELYQIADGDTEMLTTAYIRVLVPLRANYLSNRVFDDFDAMIDAACDAWRKLIAQPQQITSIGMRTWAHEGHL